jgi:hypothetical protein
MVSKPEREETVKTPDFNTEIEGVKDWIFEIKKVSSADMPETCLKGGKRLMRVGRGRIQSCKVEWCSRKRSNYPAGIVHQLTGRGGENISCENR